MTSSAGPVSICAGQSRSKCDVMAAPERLWQEIVDPTEFEEQKRIQFYSQAINAWLNLSLEYDKSLITLSTAGIGLIVTLLTTVGATSLVGLWLYALGVASFGIAIVSVLIAYAESKRYIESIISRGEREASSRLANLDRAAAISFGAGVVMLAAAGISAGVHTYQAKGKDMSKKEKTNVQVIFANDSINRLGSLGVGMESIDRLALLQPAKPVLRPATTASASKKASSRLPPPLPPQKK